MDTAQEFTVGDGLDADSAARHPSSVWSATSVPGPVLPRLTRSIATDVVILGGGITGLNAAWELTKRGTSCVLLEAEDVGWGASGRNGGMAVLRYKKFWSTLASALGDDTARRLYAYIHEALDTLEGNVADLGIDCGFSRCGHLTAAVGRRAARMLEEDVAWLQRAVGDRTPRFVDVGEMAVITGSRIYSGGYFDPRSAGIHPLNYCRGFAAALSARGVEIYRRTPASAITLLEGNDGVRVETPGGSVRARKALVCTNAYTGSFDLGNDLHRRFVPISVAVITTDEIPSGLDRPILPQGHLVTDTRNLVNYYRRAPNGGLLFGGRGSFVSEDNPKYFDLLAKQMAETFPQLRGIGIAYRWAGRVAISLDFFPHIGALGENVFYALGYGGRGVALSNLLGKHLAQHAIGEKTDLSIMSQGSFRPVPFGELRVPLMHAAAIYYRARDRLGF